MSVATKVYLAQATLQASGRDGSVRTYAPGERIEDFAAWPYDNQLSLLRLGRVKQVGGQYQANMTAKGGYWHLETPSAMPAASSPAPEAVSAGAVSRPAARPIADVLAPERQALMGGFDGLAAIAQDNLATDPDGDKTCADCGKVCKNTRGLRKHRAAAHLGTAPL